MKVSKSKRLTVNMGNYESVALNASMEIDSDVDGDALAELGLDTWDTSEVKTFLDQQLDTLMSSDVEEAAELTANDDSFVHDYEASKRSSK